MLASLLGELAEAGIKLRVAGGGRLEVTAPRGAVTHELRARIAEHKTELVDWLARTPGRAGDDGGALPTITADPAGWDHPFPPSDLQMSYLVGSREGLEYYVRPHQYMEWDYDQLDPARFERALNQALRRQRANLVVLREDMQLQMVRDPGPVRVRVSDVRHLSDAEAQAHLERVRAALQHRELPLDRWPWLEMRITLLPAGRARLHYNHNNFFIDGPGTGRFLDSIQHHYDHPDQPLPELEVSYRDCVLALAELESSPPGKAAQRYWLDRMADWPGPPDLPLAVGVDARERSRLSRRDFVLPATVWTAFKERAAARGLTPTTAVCGAYAEVISYWSGSRHFLLNNMVTHRMPLHAQIGEVMGNFAALYPLEVDWRPDEPFHDRVRRLRTRVMADLSHTHWSGTRVLQTLNQVRGTPGRAACPFVIGSGLFMDLDRPAFSRLETPQVLLDCQFFGQRDGSLWMVWDLIEAMFPAGLVDAMQAGYRWLLGRLAGHDAAWDEDAFTLLPGDQRDQRVRLNRSDVPVPEGLLHRSLAPQAGRFPDKPCVVAADRTLGYAETHRRSVELAERLRDHGVRGGDLVAVVLPKGWEQVVAVLAALTAGAAYVPIDPDWPDDRVRYLVGETAVAAVLTSDALSGRLAGLAGAAVPPAEIPAAEIPAAEVRAAEVRAAEIPAPEILAVDRVDDPGAGAAASPPAGGDPAAGVDPDDPAYVIYTSGSTGRPKGAVLNHRGPLNTIVDVNRRFGISAGDVLFGVSSLCFDLSVYDIFGAIEAGATLVLPGPDRTDPAAWLHLLQNQRVTVWNSVPALMELVVAEAVAAGVRLPALRTVLLSGDWVPVHLPQRISEVAPNARVISLGGATEASIWSICFPVDQMDPDWVSIPYGRPLANQTWHVLDGQGRDAPTWTAGDLYIGGSGVAQGYLGDPVRTAAAFVPHPRTGERLYRTGDRGRYLPGGEIEFLGRADFQVKIQGFRVEPGEVEQVLSDHPAVRQAVVVARATPSGKQLAAFVVCRTAPAAPGPAELRAFLADRLPGYLVPSHLTVLDDLPLTANGKVDRPALEAVPPSEPAADRGYLAPRTPTEEALVAVWQEILSVPPVGVHDDFFALGGQSFAALRMIGLVRKRLGRQLPISAVLELRTVAALADRLDAEATRWSPLVRLRAGAGTDPGMPRAGDGRAALQAGAGADPWFLVHPAGGDVLCYRELAELVGRPCYAFQAPGPAVGRAPLQDVEDLAREYLPELLTAQPRGPYLLGGWSSGGTIAFELAHQLERRGEVVDRVVMMDAPAPVAAHAVDDVTSLLWFLEDLDIGFDAGRVTDDVLRELAALPDDARFGRALAVAHDARDARDARDPVGREVDADRVDLVNTLAVFRGVVRACNRYRAPTVAADITVLRARQGRVTEFADHPCLGSPDWGWGSLTSGRVDAVAVPGTHRTMLGARHVAAVAAAIDDHRVRHRPGRASRVGRVGRAG